jgi:DNA replication and repair protein RecF
MHLEWLELRGFRCYETLDFRPEPGLNVLVGPNGAGKTSILEAVNYLSALRSFRRTPDPELVRRGDASGVVRGGFRRASGEVRVEVELPAAGRRRILLNAKRPRRHADVKIEIPMVAFLPDDLDIVKRGPALRREYVDDLAARLSPQAGADQQDYEKALRQRNALLRRDGRMADRLTLDTYDEQLAARGSDVLLHRLRVMEQLLVPLQTAHATVGGSGELTWSYVASWTERRSPLAAASEVADDFIQALASRRERDLDQKTTTAGPHRDDPSLLLDGRSIRSQASQGEQRSVALSLRVAAYHVLEDRNQAPPMLLLDDVFSELDPQRAAGVLELLPRGQVLVTSARDDEVGARGRRWRVEEGRVMS